MINLLPINVTELLVYKSKFFDCKSMCLYDKVLNTKLFVETLISNDKEMRLTSYFFFCYYNKMTILYHVS